MVSIKMCHVSLLQIDSSCHN